MIFRQGNLELECSAIEIRCGTPNNHGTIRYLPPEHKRPLDCQLIVRVRDLCRELGLEWSSTDDWFLEPGEGERLEVQFNGRTEHTRRKIRWSYSREVMAITYEGRNGFSEPTVAHGAIVRATAARETDEMMPSREEPVRDTKEMETPDEAVWVRRAVSDLLRLVEADEMSGRSEAARILARKWRSALELIDRLEERIDQFDGRMCELEAETARIRGVWDEEVADAAGVSEIPDEITETAETLRRAGSAGATAAEAVEGFQRLTRLAEYHDAPERERAGETLKGRVVKADRIALIRARHEHLRAQARLRGETVDPDDDVTAMLDFITDLERDLVDAHRERAEFARRLDWVTARL